jgi:hypothetical protein
MLFYYINMKEYKFSLNGQKYNIIAGSLKEAIKTYYISSGYNPSGIYHAKNKNHILDLRSNKTNKLNVKSVNTFFTKKYNDSNNFNQTGGNLFQTINVIRLVCFCTLEYAENAQGLTMYLFSNKLKKENNSLEMFVVDIKQEMENNKHCVGIYVALPNFSKKILSNDAFLISIFKFYSIDTKLKVDDCQFMENYMMLDVAMNRIYNILYNGVNLLSNHRNILLDVKNDNKIYSNYMNMIDNANMSNIYQSFLMENDNKSIRLLILWFVNNPVYHENVTSKTHYSGDDYDEHREFVKVLKRVLPNKFNVFIDDNELSNLVSKYL